MATEKPLRWGIVTTGKISFCFANALDSLPRSQHQMAAVSSRDQSSADKFAGEFTIPKAYGSHAQLFNDPDIDVVYVGILTKYHYQICKEALEAGKHVLCEKTMTCTAKHTKQLTQLAKRKGLFLMEGYWCRCFPAYTRLREELTAGTIGDVRLISAELGANILFYNPDYGTEKNPSGALGAVGCYPLQLAQFVFGSEMPQKIVSSSVLQENGCDVTTCATLTYSGDRMLQMSSSMGLQMKNVAYIYGTKGCIEIPDYFGPSKLVTPSGTQEFPLPEVARPMPLPQSEGFVYEAECVRKCIQNGETECPLVPHQDSHVLAEIMDIIAEQTGITYTTEDK